MGNLINYINEYGNIDLIIKKVNDIDILLFSQIPVWEFKNILFKYKDEIKLSFLWKLAKRKDLDKFKNVYKRTYKIMENMCNCKRYKDIIIKNYAYYSSKDTQFGAYTLILPNNSSCIVFQGTDDTIGSWKDNFELLYKFPTTSQKYAIKYLDSAISNKCSNIIVCGHSKGGNLALVSTMNINFIKRRKIKKIYSFDGPGLRIEEFNSLNYKMIKNKIVNIVPESSCVGVLLNQEKVKFVKTNSSIVKQHDPLYWIINKDNFEITSQSTNSKDINNAMNRWLKIHSYEEIEKMCNEVFNVFKNSRINKIGDLKDNKIESIYKLIKASRHIPKDAKELIVYILKVLIVDYVKSS